MIISLITAAVILFALTFLMYHGVLEHFNASLILAGSTTAVIVAGALIQAYLHTH